MDELMSLARRGPLPIAVQLQCFIIYYFHKTHADKYIM